MKSTNKAQTHEYSKQLLHGNSLHGSNRAGSLELALSSLPLISNFLGGGGISSLVVVRAFSSASPSPVHAGEGDVRHFHWSAFIFLPFSNKLVQEVRQQEEFFLTNLHLMYQFCGYVCFREIYSWSFFENQIDWFIADKRCGSFGMVL